MTSSSPSARGPRSSSSRRSSHALRGRGHAVRTVATGQHDDPRLADDFFADLGARPRRALGPARRARRHRVGALLTHAYEELGDAVSPTRCSLLGDTHTVPLFGLAARRSGVPVVHLEAGLRSFNDGRSRRSHRRAAAAIASLHLAPTALAARMLEAEGVDPRRVSVVGNPITDTLRPPRTAARVPVDARRASSCTAHRATNVDDPARLPRLRRARHRLAARGRAGDVPRPPAHRRAAARVRAARPVLERHGRRRPHRTPAVPRDARRGRAARAWSSPTPAGSRRRRRGSASPSWSCAGRRRAGKACSPARPRSSASIRTAAVAAARRVRSPTPSRTGSPRSRARTATGTSAARVAALLDDPATSSAARARRARLRHRRACRRS